MNYELVGVSLHIGEEHPFEHFYKFKDMETAQEWLETEEYDSRTRILFKTEEELKDFIADLYEEFLYETWAQEREDLTDDELKEMFDDDELAAMVEWWLEGEYDSFPLWEPKEDNIPDYVFNW